MGGDTRSNRQMEARSKVNSQSPGNPLHSMYLGRSAQFPFSENCTISV